MESVIPQQTSPAPAAASARPQVRGKFLYVRDRKFFVKGVTYGPFKPENSGEDTGSEYHTPGLVERDFAQMAASGYNAVRCYTVPPRWLLDIASKNQLLVMIGLPWEQHITFLDSAKRQREIEDRIRQGVRSCAGHPALLCYAVGNEIPAPIVRWYGARPIERFIKRLCIAVRAEDPGCLLTYVNYPSTEYLRLPFLDLIAFNVYLETREKLEIYLAKLQIHAGDRPLLMAEVGLDSIRNGEQKQADTLTWQILSVFNAGTIGVFVFAWTDEWFRGGAEIEDWAFGLVGRDRSPKAALEIVSQAFTDALPGQKAPASFLAIPVAPGAEKQADDCISAASTWPKVSIAVCTRNRASALDQCLKSLANLQYPNLEIIVVDDGSTDPTEHVTAAHQYKTIRIESRGLSSARNAALAAAGGQIIAYIDDDAWPDSLWLTYLVNTFAEAQQRGESYAGVGGPNIPPPIDSLIADCIAAAPGGPTHVLLTDREAEHIPGCNMAFVTRTLREIGGFDERFVIAGDDVDICWRLLERGHRLGFSPSAVVWHQRRSTIRGYWQQQFQYGRAEASLERKWPAKYDAAGQARWAGHVYGQSSERESAESQVFFGTWGSAPFQSIYRLYSSSAWSLALRPEWYLSIFALLLLGFGGLAWHGLFFAWALMGLMLMATFAIAARLASRSLLHPPTLQKRSIVAILHIMQPAARLLGRLTQGMGPWSAWWRLSAVSGWAGPWPITLQSWSEGWRSIEDRIGDFEKQLISMQCQVARGGEYDRWDLLIRGGTLGGARMLMTIEEHGGGKQMMRMRIFPWLTRSAKSWIIGLLILTGVGWIVGGRGIGIVSLILMIAIVVRSLREITAAMATARRGFLAAMSASV